MCWQCWASGSLGQALPDAPSGFQADQPQPTAPRLHLTPTGDAAVDGLMSGFAWSLGDPLSFAFPDSSADYEAFYGASEPARSFMQIGAAMRDAVRKILLGEAAGIATGSPPGSTPGSPGPAVLDFTHLAIAEAAEDRWADLRIARSSAPSTAWAYYPNAREGGDVWFGNRHGFDNPRLGTYQFMVAVHELGHALGLKHPHETSNGFAAVPLDRDSLEFTVMSYRSKPGASVTSGYTNGTFDYAQGWMMLDIAALQALYGADFTHRAGDTRYRWDPLTGETIVDGIAQGLPGGGAAHANRVFLTIWDGGGSDTFDLSDYGGGVAVDLAPGGWSTLSPAQLATLDSRDGTKARGNVFNSLLFEGNAASLIENALGGAGADTLAGNDAANRLEGGAGHDRLEGREGSDWLVGGAGADTMLGGPGGDTFVVDSAADLVVEVGAGLDTVIVTTAQPITLPEGVEMLTLAVAGSGIGNEAANLLRGSAGADRLDGRGGNDLVEGGGGADTLRGGGGADLFLFRRGDGFDRIEDFAPGQDRLVLTGFSLDAAALLAQAQATAQGLWLDLGGGDGVLLAALTPGRLAVSDFVF